MKPYFYHGSINSALRARIASNEPQFQATMRAGVEAFGGNLIRCHLLASTSGDPIGFLEFPEDIAARSWNAFYASQEGVLSSTIKRLLDETDLAEMHRLIEQIS
jgi:hypothetical protein